MVRVFRLTAITVAIGIVLINFRSASAEDWRSVYSESFDKLPAGIATTSDKLLQWEGGSAAESFLTARRNR